MIWRQNDQNFWVRWQNTKVIKLQWIETIWHLNDENFRVTSQNYKSHQITMNCIDLTSKLSKMLSYIAKHSKQRKSTKRIKLQWIASIWCQNDQKCWVTSQNIQNNAKLRKWSNYNEMHRFDVKTMTTLEWRRKTTKVIKLQWIAPIWRQNDKKCWVTSQNIQNNAKLQNWSNYNVLHWFDVKTFELGGKTTKVIKLQWIASMWRQNDKKMLSYVAKHSKQRKTTKVIIL